MTPRTYENPERALEEGVVEEDAEHIAKFYRNVDEIQRTGADYDQKFWKKLADLKLKAEKQRYELIDNHLEYTGFFTWDGGLGDRPAITLGGEAEKKWNLLLEEKGIKEEIKQYEAEQKDFDRSDYFENMYSVDAREIDTDKLLRETDVSEELEQATDDLSKSLEEIEA